jgi:hypothetical protein
VEACSSAYACAEARCLSVSTSLSRRTVRSAKLRIAEFAGCRVLREMIERSHEMIFNWLFDFASSRLPLPLPLHFHRNLIASLNTAKAAAADRAMRCYVRFGLEDVAAQIASREGQCGSNALSLSAPHCDGTAPMRAAFGRP